MQSLAVIRSQIKEKQREGGREAAYMVPKDPSLNRVKGQLQRFYKLMSYEKAFKMLKNDMCITKIGQAVLELWSSKDGWGNPH